MKERRRFPRVALDAAVSVIIPARQEEFESRMRDLSETGVFILTEDTRPIGTGLELTLAMAEGGLVVRLRGMIVHEVKASEASETCPCGIGVMFLEVDAFGREGIRRLMKRGQPI